jgi:hypothetical protein
MCVTGVTKCCRGECAPIWSIASSPGSAATRFRMTEPMGNLARQLGPQVIEQLHRRVVEIAQENKIAVGRKMRVDTTVVETDIHYRMSRVKLVYSAGVSPARARVRGPVAWIVRRKETESRKSIDKAILGMVSESSGRNESKRIGGPENVNPRGRALGNGVKAAWNIAIWPMRWDTLAG